jgi:carbon monoxide dehydrogenase subunit G
MATIRKEIPIAAPPEAVWPAVRDVGAVHRLAPGFVLESHLDGEWRTVTFASGMVARELIVAVDDGLRRVAYAIPEGGKFRHYHGSIEVLAAGADTSRLVWTIDLLPDEMAVPISAAMEEGSRVMKATLERPQG